VKKIIQKGSSNKQVLPGHQKRGGDPVRGNLEETVVSREGVIRGGDLAWEGS